MRVDYDTGEVVADGMIKLQGTFFSAVLSSSPLLASNGNVTIETGVAGANTAIRLKVCKRNVWVDVRQQPSILNGPDSSQIVGNIDKADVFRLGIAAFSEAEMKAAGVTLPLYLHALVSALQYNSRSYNTFLFGVGPR